jgi:hypothetical protein
MRAPRSVTLAPMGFPARSLKPAIDFFALVTSASPGNHGQVGHRSVEERLLLGCEADAAVEDDLLEAHLHDVVEPSSLQLRAHVGLVALLEARAPVA